LFRNTRGFTQGFTFWLTYMYIVHQVSSQSKVDKGERFPTWDEKCHSLANFRTAWNAEGYPKRYKGIYPPNCYALYLKWTGQQVRQNLVKFIPTKWNPGYTTAELPAAIYATDFVMKQAERVLPKRHLSGKCWYLALSELTTSASVSLSVSCTVHVSGAGPDVYPLTSLQSVSSLAVCGCTATEASKTTKILSRNSAPIFRPRTDRKLPGNPLILTKP